MRRDGGDDLPTSPLSRGATGAEQIGRLYATFAHDAARSMQPVVDFWARRQEALQQQMAQVARLVENVARQRDLYGEVYPLLAEQGWVVSPSTPALLLDELMIRVRRSGPAQINEWMVELYRPSLCRQSLEDCLDRPSFAPWASTWRKAMMAHERGDPELAIPIWLLAIDGICATELGTADIFSKVGTRKKRNHLSANLAHTLAGDALYALEVEGLLRILFRLGRPGSIRSRDQDGDLLPRRHDILHGGVPSIGDEEYSIRCILVLAHLEWLLEARDDQVSKDSRDQSRVPSA